VEFIYRLGRINQKQNKNTLALNYFDKAIAAGKNLPYYYAMVSSIEMATIYESSNDLVLAKKYYTKALTFSKNKEYVNSLEQRAKAGLSRVTK
jgi:Tfp pilus assembly protein PilF